MSRNPKPKSARGCQAGACGYWSVCERHGASAELSLLLQQERPVRMGAAGIASSMQAVSLSRDGASVSLLAKGEVEPVMSGPKQGVKPTEVYGFVGAISTLVAFGPCFCSFLENLFIFCLQLFLFLLNHYISFVCFDMPLK
jgi:hypothetical protein